MTSSPLMSFIVLTYNYRNYVVETLRSALAQSVQDFEIVVVDDCSSDDSAEVVRSFTDPRIRLLRNDRNMGGAWSYNKAISVSQGEFLVNLDADDWIDPHKCEKQLKLFREDDKLSIVGTYIRAIDKCGHPHSNAEELEQFTNRPLDLNRVDSWVVQNPLCRSSTMVRRSAHLQIGLDDPTMIYACDFELWTRALNQGLRFAIVPEKLCSYRWHGGNITHKDPRNQYLEIAYIFARNITPLIERKALFSVMARVLAWFSDHEQFPHLSPRSRYRIIASLFSSPPTTDYAGFKEAILSPVPDIERETFGRRIFALFQRGPGNLAGLAYELDTKRLTSAVDHYRQSSEEWERRYHILRSAVDGGSTLGVHPLRESTWLFSRLGKTLAATKARRKAT